MLGATGPWPPGRRGRNHRGVRTRRLATLLGCPSLRRGRIPQAYVATTSAESCLPSGLPCPKGPERSGNYFGGECRRRESGDRAQYVGRGEGTEPLEAG